MDAKKIAGYMFDCEILKLIEVKESGKYLSDIRRMKGMSLKEASEITGISMSYLHRLENNKKVPSYSTLSKLTKGYGLIEEGVVSSAHIKINQDL
ncbi:helix-turn-helix domain-containing protein [Planococcus maritimus]|uniref:helix-turn-helix domain-containing protein n=1 Tax=Planococcus maritimus TaxID=192421 RepID=UPI00313A2F50